MTEPAQIMVIAPHPDDAEMGVAGSVARWTSEGKDVVYVICTNGNKGTIDTSIDPEKLSEIREQEQLAAAEILGVRDVVFLRYPDQGLEDTAAFRKDIVREIRRFQPETVATTDPHRRYLSHRDHRITGIVTLDAVYPYARDLLAYPDLIEEGFQPHKVKKILLWGAEDLNYHSDITDTFETKIAAIFCHKSQFGERSSSEMEHRMKERYRILAEGQDFELAEAFHQVDVWR